MRHARNVISPVRRATGVVVLVVSPALGLAAGFACFFAAAAVSAKVQLLCIAALIGTALMVTAASSVGWHLLRRIHRTGRFSTVVTLACAGLAGAAIFIPGPSPAAGPAPAWVQFWDLPTGSRIAFAHQVPTGTRRPYPLIFLHGGPGTPGNGLPAVAGALAAVGYDVYSYDQLGAGRSTRLTDVTGYTVARQVSDLDAIRTVLNADKLALVGQSWGGSLAANYLAAHPERVDRVVFTSPGPMWPAAWPGGGTGDPWARLSPGQRELRDKLTARPRIYAAAILQTINPNAAHALVGDDEADNLLHRIAVLGKDATICAGGPPAPVHDNHQGFYVNQVTNADFSRIADPRPQLRQVTVPALILRGTCDFIPWPVTREYRQVLGNATLISVPNAGHGIAAEQPEQYAHILEAFFTSRRLPLPTYTGQDSPPGQ